MTQETATSSDKTPEKEKPTGFKKLWLEYIKPFLVVALVLTAARSSLLDWNDVPTGSMKPTIVEGDRILVNKLAYDLKVPYTTWRIARLGQAQARRSCRLLFPLPWNTSG